MLGADKEEGRIYIQAFLALCVSLYMSLPVSRRGDKVYAAVNSGVWDSFLPVDVDLLLQVCFVLVINELHDGLPARPQQALIERMTREEGDRKRWRDKRGKEEAR